MLMHFPLLQDFFFFFHRNTPSLALLIFFPIPNAHHEQPVAAISKSSKIPPSEPRLLVRTTVTQPLRESGS